VKAIKPCNGLTLFPALSKPSGSVLGPSFKAFGIAIRNGFKMDAARPETVEPRDGEAVPWSNAFVDDLQMALSTSRAL
jgi:POT family proton-dependent oligopeptide transporter